LQEKQFYIYIWGFTSNSWGSDYPTSEHCRRIENQTIDWTDRIKIYCDFIPPKSKFIFLIDSDLTDKANKSGIISVEYWGETTPYKEESLNITKESLEKYIKINY